MCSGTRSRGVLRVEMDVTSKILCALDLGDKIIYGLHSDTLKKRNLYTRGIIFSYLCDKILSKGNLMQEGRIVCGQSFLVEGP